MLQTGNPELLRQLLAHSEWADSVLFAAWGRSPAREHQELRQRVTHMADVRTAFVSMLTGGPPIWPKSGPPAEYSDLLDRTQQSHTAIRQLAEKLTTAGLEQRVQIPFFPDPPCIITVGEGLIQVVMHTQHHRGQCMTRLRDFNGQPENVDWIIWLWQGRPNPSWSRP